VHALAAEVASRCAEDDEAARESLSLRLLGLLDQLEVKYGPLPSILATRADYVDHSDDRERWLTAAYEQARRLRDAKNLVWIASSLAGFHVEERPDPARGAAWLAILERYLAESPDASVAEEAARLRAVLDGSRDDERTR
jgi:hypothetical protein